MRLTGQYILRWQTIDMLVFLMLAGSALTSANVWAQETKPGTGMPQSQPGIDQAKSDPPAAASEMPDITGTWQVEAIEPDNNENTFFTWEIRRVQQGEIDFLIDMPWVKEPLRVPVKWSAVRQRFEGEYKDEESDTENYRFTLQPQPDGNSLLVIHNPMKESDEYVTQMWTRVSKTLATTFPPNGLQQPETPPTESRAEKLMEGADLPTGGTVMTNVALPPSALPNTPAANDLLKRLEAQESAAATAANEIRRLLANGDAAETMAPHQAQLKAHLQTAFELKLQLEELQVQELLSRLSRLEREIGQRKEIREKIIARRAAELIDGDALKGNTKTSTFGANATETLPKLIDLPAQSNTEVPATGTPLIEPNTAIPASQQMPGVPANAQSQMVDLIRDEAYSHVEDITSLQYAFDVKDENGWHAEAQFFADQTRFRVNRKDVAGMQVKGKRLDPLTIASAFDGLRQQYLDTNGRLRLKIGCEGASYGIVTPHLDLYSWLRRGPEDLRWDIICNLELWKKRFAEAEYFGAIPDNGRTLEIVDFPARLEGQRPCTYRVFFARELGFFPIKCLRRVSATTEISTMVTVTDFKSIEKGGQKFILPTTLTYSESRADGVSMKQQRTTTIAVDSLKVNEPIDAAVFTIDDKEAKEVFSVQDQAPIATASATPTRGPGIEAIAARLDASAAVIKNISVITDYKKRHVYGLPFDAPIELTFVTKTIIDSEGRLRVETAGQQINIEPDGKSARAYNGRWETVFQKGEARSLTWYESNPPTASIDNFPSLHGIHPQEFTTHFQSKPVSEIIRTSAAEVTERVFWDDRPVTIVQTTPHQNANDARRYRFWIDPERNVVVRRAISIRYAEGQPWQEYARIENHDYQEIAPGIWLPGKVKYESLEVTPELTPAKLSWSFEGTNHDWMVNRDLPADTFELAFPEGTFVNDHRTKSAELTESQDHHASTPDKDPAISELQLEARKALQKSCESIQWMQKFDMLVTQRYRHPELGKVVVKERLRRDAPRMVTSTSIILEEKPDFAGNLTNWSMDDGEMFISRSTSVGQKKLTGGVTVKRRNQEHWKMLEATGSFAMEGHAWGNAGKTITELLLEAKHLDVQLEKVNDQECLRITDRSEWGDMTAWIEAGPLRRLRKWESRKERGNRYADSRVGEERNTTHSESFEQLVDNIDYQSIGGRDIAVRCRVCNRINPGGGKPPEEYVAVFERTNVNLQPDFSTDNPFIPDFDPGARISDWDSHDRDEAFYWRDKKLKK